MPCILRAVIAWLFLGHIVLSRDLLFRRMRKAGSTTLALAISQACAKSHVRYHETEFIAIPTSCTLPKMSPLRKFQTITNLREPVSRMASSFWYSTNVSKHLSNASDPSEIDELWARWATHNIIQTQPTKTPRTFDSGFYWDNYYVRLLTTHCTQTCEVQSSPDALTSGVIARVTFPMCGSLHGGELEPMGREHLKRAKRVLINAFDAIVFMEAYRDPACGAYLKTQLSLTTAVKLRHERQTRKYRSGKPLNWTLPEKTAQWVRRQNALDIELYEWARTYFAGPCSPNKDPPNV